ncbi:MAG: hypothetical protein ACJA0E_001017 [Bermanella sp.]|jgi:hypothetical protein
MKVLLKLVIVVSVFSLLSACSVQRHQSVDQIQANKSSGFSMLPSWYHPDLGLQLLGDNEYPEQTALASLLQKADRAFLLNELQSCQILLERAQRISTRDPGVYVRLSYLSWLDGNLNKAEQMARRAFALVASDQYANIEVRRLLTAIQANQY